MIIQYMLYSMIPNGTSFCFEVDEAVYYAIKVDDHHWVYDSRIENKSKKGVYLAPLEDEWVVSPL